MPVVLADELQGVSVPLGKLLTRRWVKDQRDVAEVRVVKAQGFVDRHLLWRVGNVVGPPDHVRDFHQVVINHHGKVVSWQPVGLLDHKVAPDVVGVEFDVAQCPVVPFVDVVFWQVDPHGWLDPLGFGGLDVFFRRIVPPTVVVRWFPVGLLLFPHFLEFFFGGVVLVG